MNLLATDWNPKECAKNLDDKRLGPQIKECAQALSTVQREQGNQDIRLYKPWPSNHPILDWLRKDERNQGWAFRLGLSCTTEYMYRFDKLHASSKVLLAINEGKPNLVEQVNPEFLPNWAANLSKGYDFRQFGAPHSYRRYLQTRWQNDKITPEWTKRGAPKWAPEWQ